MNSLKSRSGRLISMALLIAKVLVLVFLLLYLLMILGHGIGGPVVEILVSKDMFGFLVASSIFIKDAAIVVIFLAVVLWLWRKVYSFPIPAREQK